MPISVTTIVVASIGATTTIIAAGLTAFLTHRAKVREGVWESIYREKRVAARMFSQKGSSFFNSLTYVDNLKFAATADYPDSFASIYTLICERFADKVDEDERQRLLKLLPGPGETHKKSQNISNKKSLLLTELRNVFLSDLIATQEEIDHCHDEMVLVGFDPISVRLCRDYSAWVVNQIGWEAVNAETLAKVNVEQIQSTWNDLVERALVLLRQDIDLSALSYRKAVRFKKQTREKILELTKDAHGEAIKVVAPAAATQS